MMLTRKQTWRRVQRNRSNSSPNLPSYDTARLSGGSSGVEIKRSKSLSDVPVDPTAMRQYIAERKKRNRHVSFCPKASVVLVPCRKEYSDNGILGDVWWRPDDYRYFRSSAQLEAVIALQQHDGDMQGALNSLYQPTSNSPFNQGGSTNSSFHSAEDAEQPKNHDPCAPCKSGVVSVSTSQYSCSKPSNVTFTTPSSGKNVANDSPRGITDPFGRVRHSAPLSASI
eukprot:CAMPEP_0185020540 /NCGR_PEP_ID=MMETSP1103-20130426/3142_1 /TAXON_ID=36769 /ORGANISM="Paraphysomonas bandaiensis, Strain Caron Lab Isolate" /LENGTH=225 /DNA_ID=CAMNT_0027551491 /DNA_START=107 /DNA_END=784 /DNA_ORIENTATION=-